MTNSYYCDGTPLDILRRRAKALKTEQNIKLFQALDYVAVECGEESWEHLTKNCWAEPFNNPDEMEDYHFLERSVGDDLILLNFEQLSSLGEKSIPDGKSEFDIYFETSINDGSDASLQYVTRFYLEPCIYRPNFRSKISLSVRQFSRLKDAVSEYDDKLHIGSVVAIFKEIGIFDDAVLMASEEIELEALLTMLLRPKGRKLGDRVLFNTVRHTEPEPDDWDWKRVFAFALDSDEILVCNGEESRTDIRYKTFSKEEWRSIETELRSVFANPEQTVLAETWLRNKLDMDAWS